MNIDSLTQKSHLPSPKRKWVLWAILMSILLVTILTHIKKNRPAAVATPKMTPVSQARPRSSQPSISWVSGHKLSVDLDNIAIADALRMLAQFMRINLVVNPALRAKTSLHWHAVSAKDALYSFIHSQNLKMWQDHDIWYVTTVDEWLHHQEETLKIQKMMNEAAPIVTRLWRIRFAKAEDIAKVLADNHHSLLSKRGMVRVDQRTNVLCIQDVVTHISELNHLIERLDVPVEQVLIEAHLASIDSDYEKELGIQFVLGSQGKDTAINAGPYSLAVATLADGSLLNVRLAALENRGHAELISNPTLFTANLKTASIESGEEIPYQESNANGATVVAFKKAVLSLQVTPQIMAGNRILLELQVNQDKPSSRMVLGVPTIDTRQINTRIMVKDGQTIILGGIYETNKANALQRNPILDKIPLVGSFLSQQNDIERKRELLIFVTPKIIH